MFPQSYPDDYNTRSDLRDAVITCLKKFYLNGIAKRVNPLKNRIAIRIKFWIEKTSYVLKHHRTRLYL